MDTLRQLRARDLAAVLARASTSMSEHAAGIDGLDQSPIGDGDTGSNAAALLASLESLTAECRTTVELAGAIRGSRAEHQRFGAIGVWMGAFLTGVSDVASGGDDLDGSRLAIALELGVEMASSEVRGVPGGVGEVGAVAVEAALACADEGGRLDEVAVAAAEAGVVALEATPSRRPELAAAGVVDAGAAAFLVVVDALCHVIGVPNEVDEESSAGRYMVSLCVLAASAELERLRSVWGQLGGHIEITLAGDGPAACSVEADDIGAAIQAAISVGTVSRISVVDRRG